MVAVIKTGHSLQRILNYNENKVREGAALFLGASGYPIDDIKLSFNQKLNRLKNQAALNENVTRNSIHISLNFDPQEKISDVLLKELAEVYMDKIGFGDLPFLVYRHLDSGHPHAHIVSVKVREDGRRVETQNIGRNQSEKARREIEVAYKLIKADGRKESQVPDLKPVNISKVQYGRMSTKRAIANILHTVLRDYKFGSIAELNAVLKQYNVLADRGGEGSRVFRNRGLMYAILDNNGNKVGVPIKASDFYGNPVLTKIEKKFQGNIAAKAQHKNRVKNAVDMALLKMPDLNLDVLGQVLIKTGINLMTRQNGDGVIYGLTYVDHQTKCVFNGSELGKAYSAKGMLERLSLKRADEQKITDAVSGLKLNDLEERSYKANLVTQLAETLLHTENPNAMPFELKKKKRRKKKLSM